MDGRDTVKKPVPRQRTVTEDERRLWRQAMHDAHPLRPNAVATTTGEVLAAAANAAVDDTGAEMPPVDSPQAARKARHATINTADLPPLTLGLAAGVDRRTDTRLRRGQVAVDGRIDLHGMTQETAHRALAAFLHRCSAEGKRCILVITGKGNVSEGGGVLRRAVPQWLAEAPLRRLVVTLHQAHPRHGGDGALYVLLRRSN